MQTALHKLPDGSTIVVVTNIDQAVADTLHAGLDTVAAGFHSARGDTTDGLGTHPDKFDEAIETVRSCIDEFARPHTLGFATPDDLAKAVVEVATASVPAPAAAPAEVEG